MSKNHLFAKKLCSLTGLALGVLLFASCAQGLDDNETWRSDVTNTTLESPKVDDITITPSPDGKTQTIIWPVVTGASGYVVSLYDVSNIEEPIVKDSLTDRCSISVKREEDVNYRLTIQTKGNVKLNNADAQAATEKLFSTFTPTYKTIPAGTDLTQYFAQNPVPAGTGDAYNFDLEGGEDYTMSDAIDFGNSIVTLRSTSKTSHARITFTGSDAGFVLSNGFTLKYLDIDCSASAAGFISMSKTPQVPSVPVNAWGTDYDFYVISQPISVLNCKVEGVNSYFFWDNQVSCWFPANLVVDNTIVHLTTPKGSKCESGAYIWTNKGAGFIQTLTVNNSTFYCTGESEAKYFVQYGGFGIDQTKESIMWISNTITYSNCTFYNVCPTGQLGNYNGLAGKKTSYWNMKNCIFYNCSTSGVARRFLHGKQNQSTAVFENNTYMKADGTFDNPEGYDNSGTDIKEDPQFKDPANGDFTISGATQVARGTGDPRWLPSNQ